MRAGLKRNPTRNLFSTCQDDSACTVGARPDHYERAQELRERKNCSIEVEVAHQSEGREAKGTRVKVRA